MSTPDPRSTIPAALSSFQTLPLKDAARQFLAELGYKSDKFLAGAGSSPQAFLDLFAAGHPFDQAKAIVSEWKSADLLFQFTDQELNRESSLFTDDSVQRGLLKSYIFIAIELKGSEYARGKFSAIARQINRLFPMPVMVFFKCGTDIPVCDRGTRADRNVRPTLTIAVINRRVNKLDESKDVLGKVTLISGIDLAQPHRGHLDILDSLALPNLVHPQKKPISDFDTLHAAWEQIFNVELLNERFYRELANWYFWALPQVEFPADLEADDEKRHATGLIRLLTRLIFCWFLKEKGLIPEKLFHPTDLAKILKGFDPESETSSTYYQAILQNLFFATLNQRMGKDGNGQPYRIFAKDEGFQRNRATYDVNNLYRYEALFQEAPDAALAHFADIPFLNGGLFECLDRTEESSPDNSVGDSSKQTETGLSRLHFKKRYLDGFSRNPKKRPHVPDRLFFDGGETADLSAAYGDTKRKAERVTGLIRILNRYKFTIVENTPIDQEIALDPELLGKVFENLLASYNEETKTTARKQTGSFYTPRPIVDYMVDESLKAHLERKVAETILSRSNPDKIVGATFQPYNPDAATEKTWQNLPHWSQEGTTYWITFSLADSLPQEKLNAWKAERDIWASHPPEPWSDSDWKEYHERFGERLENWLDVGEGECHLRRPEIRSLVEKGLTHFDGARYDLGPWIIMPNHVHMLLRPNKGQNLSKIMQGIKGVSAKECNSLLGRTGQPFWQEESFDHIVRSQAQFDRFIRYITENPRKAKLKEGEYQRSSDNQSSPDNPVGVSPDTTGTGLSRLRSRLDQLFSYTEQPHQFSEPEVAALIAAIDALKILDPACGSGAFPMGVLHKLVYILGKLDPDNEQWKHTQLAKLDSAAMREELERAFADNADDYGRKLSLIENCLYGVDIQPIAIQISKLRFFISLVCDQKIQSSPDNPVGDSSKQSETRLSRLRSKNHGIRPLPNLETKFVAANTLIGLPEMDQMELVDPRVYKIEAEIETLHHSHFSIQRRDQKLAVQGKLKDLRKEMADLLAQSLMSRKKSEHIAEWDPFDPQSSADFFDPHWMFGKSLTKGFDVVIGNPPYIDSENMTNTNPRLREFIQVTYTMTKGNWDIYIAFYEMGFKLLSESGVLTFITPDKWISKPFGDALRLHTTDKIYSILKAGRNVFESVNVDAIVCLFTNRPQRQLRIYDVDESKIFQKRCISKKLLKPPYAYDWLFSDFFDLFAKVESQRTKLSQLGLCENACATSDAYKLQEFVEEKSKIDARAAHLKIINTGTIGKYVSKWGKREMVYLGQRYLQPVVHKSRFLAAFQNSYGKKSVLPKIIVKGLNLLDACLDSEGEIIPGKTTLMVTSENIDSLKFLLALLNSKVAFFYLKEKYPASSYNLGTTFTKDMINNLPIPTLSDKLSREMILIVDCILAAKQANPAADTSAMEREIDQQVYALYGLKPEEIALVEGGEK